MIRLLNDLARYVGSALADAALRPAQHASAKADPTKTNRGLWGIFLVALIALCATKAFAGDVWFEKDGALYSQSGDAVAKRMADASHFEKLNDKQGRIYVAVNAKEGKHSLTIAQCAADGKVTAKRDLSNERLDGFTAINAVKRVAEGRVFIDLHENPYNSLGIVLNMAGGEPMFMYGYDYFWDESGKHVAYLTDDPSSPPQVLNAMVCIDGETVRHLPVTDATLHWNKAGTKLTIVYEKSRKTYRSVVSVKQASPAVASTDE